MLLDEIEAFLRENRMTPTRFGREAVGDAKFVLQLRLGREPRRRTVERVQGYLRRQAQASVRPGDSSSSALT